MLTDLLGRARLLAPGLLLAPLVASPLELRRGDLVVADAVDDQILRIDPATGDQEILSAGGLLDQPRAVSVAADGMVWAANLADGQLLRIDPADGGQTPVFSGSISGPRDLAFASDGTLWVVGDGLWSVIVTGVVAVTERSADLDGLGAGQALALYEGLAAPGPAVSVLIAAGTNGILVYDVATDTIDTPFLLPSPVDAAVVGVTLAGGLPVATQARFTPVFSCDETVGGVYGALAASILAFGSGSPFRCPARIAALPSPDFTIHPPTGTVTFYVTDNDQDLLGPPGPARIVRLDAAADGSSVDIETLAEGVELDRPFGIAMVPEPDGPTPVLAAALALGALGGRSVRHRLVQTRHEPRRVAHRFVIAAGGERG